MTTHTHKTDGHRLRMSKLKNDRFIRAIKQEPIDATPIWLMRQAGRYLPEYRATRQRAGSFINLCKTPELACEVTLQPLQRYAFDAAILFSDILTIPDAMGLGLGMKEGEGPFFAQPVQNEQAIKKLCPPDLDQLAYVYDAIHLIQRELDNKIPLIGFCGSPWTLALYMIEGQARPGFPLAMQMMQQDPLLMHLLLDKLAQSVAAHLSAQVVAGVQAVMLFDTWGGLLDSQQYQTFSLYYINQIINHMKYTNKDTPLIVFTKGGAPWLELIAKTGCDVVGLDWTVSLKDARQRIGNKVALQGNMDPAKLLETPEAIVKEVENLLASYGNGSGHIFNLGHGITPDVPSEHVSALVEAVHTLSRPYHQ